MSLLSAWNSLAVNLADVLGYLNFSSGNRDPKLSRNLNAIFAALESDEPRDASTIPSQQPTPPGHSQSAEASGPLPAWQMLGELLRERLAELAASSAAFKESSQATALLALTWQEVLPAYLEHHRDLLFHQTAEGLFRPYFIGLVFEAILQAGSPWDETERISAPCCNS